MNTIDKFARRSDYESQIYQLTTKFEGHRIRIQTALAFCLSLSLGSIGDVDNGMQMTVAFTLFPELDPRNEDIVQGALNHSKPPGSDAKRSRFTMTTAGPHARSRTSSFSSYATAQDTMSLATNSFVADPWHTLDGVSLYSIASSRTAETDYGLYYRRMALSQTTFDSARTETDAGLKRTRSWMSVLELSNSR